MGAAPLLETGKVVRDFYERNPFPGYEAFETNADLVKKGRQGIYAQLLDDQLPLGVKILDVGCGTGQLSCFLSMTNRLVVGVDFSFPSLQKGQDFKGRGKLANVHFMQADLFRLGFREESFDYVFCNGVLHHTADAAGGFEALYRMTKPGGFLIVGLYNTYGRLFSRLRKWLFRLTRGRGLRLDFFLRQDSLGDEKKRLWWADQYDHPHEDTFTVADVLAWFARHRLEYINAVPQIAPAAHPAEEERLFEPHDPGTRVGHLLSQLGWIFTQGHEGGFFILIGRKPR